MLIEFKVSNFRSFRDEQKLSLVAAAHEKQRPECLIDRPDLKGLKGTKFLKGAAIYGANASGKSNLIKAAQFFFRFVCDSATRTQAEDPTGAAPFRLDEATATEPSRFEATFVLGDTRYMLGLSVDSARVREEYAYSYPKGYPRRIFRRTFDSDSGETRWEGPSEGPEIERGLIEKTRDNASFVSVAAQWRHPELEAVRQGLKTRFLWLDTDYSGLAATASLVASSKERDFWIRKLRLSDLGIEDLNIQWTPVDESWAPPPPDAWTPYAKTTFVNLRGTSGTPHRELLELKFAHSGAGNRSILFDPDDESEGTLRYFSLLGPWMAALAKGLTVFLDEIEAHLHPILVRKLLDLFFSSEHNPHGAQIVFATHDATLLAPSLLRRDQVWFVSKTREGASILYPLSDYKPRKDEAFGRGYLLGRYGAIPHIPDGLAPVEAPVEGER